MTTDDIIKVNNLSCTVDEYEDYYNNINDTDMLFIKESKNIPTDEITKNYMTIRYFKSK